MERRRPLLRLATLLIASLVAACEQPGSRDRPTAGSVSRATTLTAGTAATGRPDLDVLLLTIDTLRADALGAYGREAAGTPWMDRLASEGVLFSAAHAHNVVTLPSHASILSGLLPLRHGVRDNAGFRYPASVPTLASRLRTLGYRTGAFVSAFPLDSRFGLDEGFDVYEDSFADTGVRPAFLEQERAGSETVELARAWMERDDPRPTFTWVHLYEPHFPYDPPEPLAARFAGEPYQGDVAAADAALAPLLTPLLANPEAAGTVVILTSDHGESLGEHGEETHGLFAYESVLRVPLIVWAPGLLEPHVVESEARLVDVVPTVLELLDQPVPEDLDGVSLLPAMHNASGPTPPTYFEALSGSLHRGWAPLHGVLRDGWKYIDLPLPELYDLRSDPGETTNRVARATEKARSLRALLDNLRADGADVRPSVESAEVRERLATLGYAAGGGGARAADFSAEDDPKRLIELDRRLREVTALYEAGDLEAAARAARELVGRRSGMRIALLQLAQIEHDLGNLEPAIEALRSAVELLPTDTVARGTLAAYLIQAGRPEDALGWTETPPGIDATDVELLLTRSLALARLGRMGEGFATLEGARELDPGNPSVPVYVGTLHLMAGRRGEARRSYEEALAMNPSTLQALTALAVMATDEARIDEALSYWRRAVALDSREAEKLLAIAGRLWQAGRRADARPLLELFVETAPRESHGEAIRGVRRMLAEPPTES